MDRTDLWIITEEEVIRLGIPVTCKGYYYLVGAVVLSVEIGMRKASLSKDIYCRLAEMNDVSSQSVEKCIRNCLLKAWTNDSGCLRETYPDSSRKPTNSEVIAYITSRIRLETALRI